MKNQIQHVEKQRVRIESDYKSKYEGIMTEKLQELRDIYDEENEKLTNDVQKLYLDKVGFVEDNITFCLVWKEMPIHQKFSSFKNSVICLSMRI